MANVDTLLIVEKGFRSGMYHPVHPYAKPNNNYMEDYDTSKCMDGRYDKIACGMDKKQVYIQRIIHTRLWWRQWQRIHTGSWC